MLFLINILFILSNIFFVLAAYLDPGYPPKEKIDFVKIVETHDCNMLCPNCETIYTPDLRHCYICNRCIDRFDHHCNWINNCVGKRNHLVFYFYISILLAYFIILEINLLMNIKIELNYEDLSQG